MGPLFSKKGKKMEKPNFVGLKWICSKKRWPLLYKMKKSCVPSKAMQGA